MKKKCQKYTEIQRSGEGKYKDSRKEAVEKEDGKLSMTTAMAIQTKTHLANHGWFLYTKGSINRQAKHKLF